MKRKWFVLFNLVLIACLLAVGSVPVQASTPDRWTQIPLPAEVSLTPGTTALEVFQGKLFASFMDFDRGTAIWRMEKDGLWNRATEFGFGTQEISAVADMISFKGMLYATATDWANRIPSSQLWRSRDGHNWEAVTKNGFDQPYSSKFNQFEIFNDKLYMSAGMYGPDGSSVGLQIWRSTTGAPGTWHKVVNNGLGDTLATGTTALIAFKGALYTIIETDWQNPTRVWRTRDGVNWSVVTNDGFGDPFNVSPGGAAIFRDYLYIGMQNLDESKVDSNNPANNPGPGQIWRTKDGLHWERVMTGGFGDWHNYKVDSLYTFNGRLYAATYCYDWVTNVDEEGVQVWSSPDGLHWTQVNENGFGDKYNYVTHLSVDVTDYKGSLYYGTWNEGEGEGGQIWKLGR